MTYDELKSLLIGFGYYEKQGNGSRVKFYIDGNEPIIIHKPHPGNILKSYVVKQLHDILNKYK